MPITTAIGKNHSTVSAMLQLSDAIFHGCDVKSITTLVTLDQSSAFDVLCHQTLSRKLSLYNFGENVLTWIDSYLKFRSQYVTIGTRNSTYSNVKSGVPQGSVLGPIFYVLYVNELPSIMDDDDCTEDVHVRDNDSNLFPTTVKSADKCRRMLTTPPSSFPQRTGLKPRRECSQSYRESSHSSLPTLSLSTCLKRKLWK